MPDLHRLFAYNDWANRETLASQIRYTNTQGQAWTNTVEDIPVMHSAYHRAQVAAELRATGHEPANTDFIHAVRQGFVK